MRTTYDADALMGTLQRMSQHSPSSFPSASIVESTVIFSAFTGSAHAAPVSRKTPSHQEASRFIPAKSPIIPANATRNMKGLPAPRGCWRAAALLKPSDTTTFCSWKGTAHYHTLHVDGAENPNAAWYYPDPKAKAENIRDRIAFWKGVTVG